MYMANCLHYQIYHIIANCNYLNNITINIQGQLKITKRYLDTAIDTYKMCVNCSISSLASQIINAIMKWLKGKGKGSPYSITERRVPELIPVLGSQPAGDVSYKPGGRLLLSARPAVTPTTLKRAANQFCCSVNRGTMSANSLPKSVTRQRRDCDLNPCLSWPESSTLTTRLLSHLNWLEKALGTTWLKQNNCTNVNSLLSDIKTDIKATQSISTVASWHSTLLCLKSYWWLLLITIVANYEILPVWL